VLVTFGGSRKKGGVVVMRRLGMIVALGMMLGLAGGMVTASPAMAGRGDGWQVAPAQPFTLAASFCGFKVRVTFPVNKEYSKILKTSDGTMTSLVTGSLQVSFTNLETGKTITENVSGPAKFTAHPDGSLAFLGRGRGFGVLTPAHAQRFGLPILGVTAGAVTEQVAPDGSTTAISLHGHVAVDVCAALS
jgi:hypothetical protein